MKYKIECEECGRNYSDDQKIYNCTCGGKLLINTIISEIDLHTILERGKRRVPLQEKYFEFLPIHDKSSIVSLGEGCTPYFRAERLGEELGLKNLWIKNETVNPTGSYKDRPILVGLSKALEFGANTVATASSGNAASSLAAGAAKTGIICFAFVPESIPESKDYFLQQMGANVFRVKVEDPSVDPTAKLLKEGCKKFGWHPVAPFGIFNPYQIEGSKTIAYEIAEVNMPDHIIVGIGSAGGLVGLYRGFKDYLELGFIDQMPHLHAVQSEGCAPFTSAYNENRAVVAWENPNTIAKGLADNFTPDWREGFDALKGTNGKAITLSDKEILYARQLLGKLEGIFAEPTGAASLAGIINLISKGGINRDEAICCIISGSGFKDLDLMKREYKRSPLIRPLIERLII